MQEKFQNSISYSSQTPFIFHTINQTVEHILKSFEYQLQVKNLLNYIAEYNAVKVDEIQKQCVSYFYLQGQSNKKKINIEQEKMPETIQIDNIITCHMKIEENSMAGVCEQQKQIKQRLKKKMNETSRQSVVSSLNYSMSKTQTKIKNSQQNKIVNSQIKSSDVKQIHEFLQESGEKLLNNTSNSQQVVSSNQVVPLKINKENQDQTLQNQLQNIKKHLYIMRRYRKQNLQQQRQRLDRLVKKKQSHIFQKNSNHTYQYDGTPISLKNKKQNHQLLTEINHSLERNDSLKEKSKILFGNKLKKKITSSNADLNVEVSQNISFDQCYKLEENNPQRRLSSQHMKKISFSNSNSRQISHLPFIILKDNTKIIENKKQLSGSISLRNSLNKSKISSHNSQSFNFKSFSKIQQEQRLQKNRQKALQNTQNQANDMLQIDIIPPTLNLNQNCQPLRKQSKMMQKYLKKLTEQKSKIQKWIQNDEGSKNYNFKQLKVPQKYPIQRYYAYDYEGEKQNYQFEITSKLSSKRNSIISQAQQN